MKKRRGILLIAGLVVLATVSVAATIEILRVRLPAPETADRDGLFLWLVASDLQRESLQTRHQLIERLEVELDEGIDFGQIRTQLDADQQQKLLANTDILLGDWYCLKCKEYHATDSALQAELLDRRIEQVEQWGILEDLFKSTDSSSGGSAPTVSDASLSSTQMLEAFVLRTNQWTDRAEVQERDALRRFTVAIKGRLLIRALRSFTQGL